MRNIRKMKGKIPGKGEIKSMRKKALTIVAAGAMTMTMSIIAFAGNVGWRYEESDDYGQKRWAYYINESDTDAYRGGWHWIDDNGDGIGERYSFGYGNGGKYISINGELGTNSKGQYVQNGEVLTVNMDEFNSKFHLPNPTSEQIVHDFSHFDAPLESTNYFFIDESRPEQESGLTNIYFSPQLALGAYCRYGGWLTIPVEYPGTIYDDISYVLVAVKPLDAPDKVFATYQEAKADAAANPYTEEEKARKLYLYRNTTTPDGFYVNQYGLMTKDGKVVVHNSGCTMQSSWGTGRISGSWIGWMHPFGTQPFAHLFYLTDEYIAKGYDFKNERTYAFGVCAGLPESESGTY